MAVDLHALAPEVTTPAGLTVEEIGAGPELSEWTRVVSASHVGSGGGRDVATYERLLLDAHTALAAAPGRPARHYLARLDGRPVGAAASLVAAGVVGLYWIGTLEDARGQGVGTAVTRAPLLAAREEGYRVGILHASPLGFPVYRRMGFHQYCTYDRWVGPA
jgi:GNAT superfamily N-acetyltransferase